MTILCLDFIATGLSQTEANYDFWLISDDPNLGEEPQLKGVKE